MLETTLGCSPFYYQKDWKWTPKEIYFQLGDVMLSNVCLYLKKYPKIIPFGEIRSDFCWAVGGEDTRHTTKVHVKKYGLYLVEQGANMTWFFFM